MSLTYPTEVVAHFKRPKNLGRMKNPDAVGEAGNIICGDVMRVYLKVKDGKISDIKGEVFGCIVAIANTSLLTTMVKGKSLEDAIKMKKETLIKRLGGKKLPPIKLHCSVLALDALKEAVYNYYRKHDMPIPKTLEEEHARIQKTLHAIEDRHKELIRLEREFLEAEK